MNPRSTSLRARILLLVLGVALLPLLLVGSWLSGTAVRSGEELLSVRLQEALTGAAGEVARAWTQQRSALLDLAEASGLGGADSVLNRPALERGAAALTPAVASVTLRDSAGNLLWEMDRRGGPGVDTDLLPVALPLYSRDDAHAIGSLEARLHPSLLLEQSSEPSLGIPGVIVGAVDRHTGSPLLPLPFDMAAAAAGRFTLLDERWLAERRELTEPAVTLIGAAPLTPFVQPFETAARQGLWLLMATGSAGLLAAVWLTTRMTRSLARLAGAADAIARGRMNERVPVAAQDEVGRVAHAFNTMAESLRRTMDELGRRESVAAVGEFASELAHEIRNPLTAIRVDLEVVQERMTGDAGSREALDAAMAQVQRLDRSVTGALQLARSGQITRVPLDVREPLLAAVRAARPAFDQVGATLVVHTPELPLTVQGDEGALQQMLLNLLLNAAQAMSTGQEAEVDAKLDADKVGIRIRDGGRGMPSDVLERSREPFFTTRPGGTGLGLGIAERIAKAHGGELVILSAEGVGTTVEVRLPAERPGGSSGR